MEAYIPKCKSPNFEYIIYQVQFIKKYLQWARSSGRWEEQFIVIRLQCKNKSILQAICWEKKPNVNLLNRRSRIGIRHYAKKTYESIHRTWRARLKSIECSGRRVKEAFSTLVSEMKGPFVSFVICFVILALCCGFIKTQTGRLLIQGCQPFSLFALWFV